MRYTNLLSAIRVDDLNGTAVQMVKIYEDEDLTTFTDYSPLIDELRTLTTMLTEAINKNKTQSELAELDKVRDQELSNLDIVLQAATLSSNSSEADGAVVLKEVFDRYGVKIARLNYSAETSQIQSLIADYNSPSYGNLLLSIDSVKNQFAKLVTAQENFELKEKEFNAAKVEEKAEDSASELKPQLLEVINNNIVSYHSALASLKGDPILRYANEMEGLIEEANQLIRTRSNNREA